MPQLFTSLAGRLTSSLSLSVQEFLRLLPLVAIHAAALIMLHEFETGALRTAIFLLSWGFINFLLIALLRRPALAGALSLAIFGSLIWISLFKFGVIKMTANFMDVMIIDRETFSFLWKVSPQLRIIGFIAAVLAIPLAVLLWWVDPWRIRRRTAAAAAALCLATVASVSLAFPYNDGEAFGHYNNVSMFVRSGIEGVHILANQGFLERDAGVAQRLTLPGAEACHPGGKPPHIILLHDESSFDIRAVNGIKVPEGYGEHFRSFDGKTRTMMVEGAGGPSWYTEYNVLSGLSSRSYGRFQFFVTRIAGGRIKRGLPNALRHCGYRTFAIYPVNGAFLGSRSFYNGVGVQRFVDGQEIRGREFEPDRFYFDNAVQMIGHEREKAPMFLYVYLTANHFPYDTQFRPDLTSAGWRVPGNALPVVDEYLRRQAMTARDYQDFIARLKREFPGEPFLIVRYGDHQPDFAATIVDPTADFDELERRVAARDPRYFTSYYAIDALNFRPANLSSALDPLDAPYLPLVALEAAGLPLDPSFAEQKRILQRCKGMFYACGDGAEARRFNRLLIEAGLITGL
jgi:phosphoglycerol transferase MdoB-like AlkP superfamily enzyme